MAPVARLNTDRQEGLVISEFFKIGHFVDTFRVTLESHAIKYGVINLCILGYNQYSIFISNSHKKIKFKIFPTPFKPHNATQMRLSTHTQNYLPPNIYLNLNV